MDKRTLLEHLSERLGEMRERYSVKSLSIFGSAVRDELTAESDIDILVDFEVKATFDLFMDLKFYLEDILQRRVDLVTDKALREPILKSIEQNRLRVS